MTKHEQGWIRARRRELSAWRSWTAGALAGVALLALWALFCAAVSP